MITLTSPHGAAPSTSSSSPAGGEGSKKEKDKEKEGGGCKLVGKMKGSLDIWTATQIGNIKDPDSTIRIFIRKLLYCLPGERISLNKDVFDLK